MPGTLKPQAQCGKYCDVLSFSTRKVPLLGAYLPKYLRYLVRTKEYFLPWYNIRPTKGNSMLEWSQH